MVENIPAEAAGRRSRDGLSLLTCHSTATCEFRHASPIEVHFSPKGGCTEAVVKEMNAAKTSILIQAYSFTSTRVAKALVEAHKRGVTVEVILDRSNRTKNSSAGVVSQQSTWSAKKWPLAGPYRKGLMLTVRVENPASPLRHKWLVHKADSKSPKCRRSLTRGVSFFGRVPHFQRESAQSCALDSNGSLEIRNSSHPFRNRMNAINMPDSAGDLSQQLISLRFDAHYPQTK